ncbi:MAG: peptide-methionine (S)-S-oxide reductase MsrA [Verrucomicrobia bacterium]|nr:peptide-methionine (S)-S-oxide reductase MsrA [Verrucomicrobiota bacterium]
MNRRLVLSLLMLVPTLAACDPKPAMTPAAHVPATIPVVPEGAETATLGGGCFWCIEAAFRQLDGVISATSGYMGGQVKDPTYEQVCDQATGHAEVVQVVFDPRKISYERVLAWFWELHDPTTLNRQGNDEGPQYRSVIFHHSEAQRKIAEASKSAAGKNFDQPIVTAITKATQFYPAENYHQNYYFENKTKNGYCKYVIEPKLKKLKLEH